MGCHACLTGSKSVSRWRQSAIRPWSAIDEDRSIWNIYRSLSPGAWVAIRPRKVNCFDCRKAEGVRSHSRYRKTKEGLSLKKVSMPLPLQATKDCRRKTVINCITSRGGKKLNSPSRDSDRDMRLTQRNERAFSNLISFFGQRALCNRPLTPSRNFFSPSQATSFSDFPDFITL